MSMKKFIGFCAVIIGLIALSFAAKDYSSFIYKYEQNVVKTCLVYNTYEDGRASLGSGFFIAPKYLVTNYHVAEFHKTLSIHVLGEPYDAEAIYGNQELDVAVLYVPQGNFKFSRFADYLPKVGEEIYSIGNPRGMEHTFSTGYVSHQRRLDIILPKPAVIQLNSGVYPGSSGSPVFNMDDEVVAIIFAVTYGAPHLGYAVPAILFKDEVLGAVALHQAQLKWGDK